jgi:hypothetical protein
MKRDDDKGKGHSKAQSKKPGSRESVEIEDQIEQNWEPPPPLHKNARTTREMRREFQLSNESSRALARRYGLDEKTVTKHRRRSGGDDLPAGRRSTAFTESEEELIEGFRRFTNLNLRDCVERLAPLIPQLNLNNLHRLTKRVGLNRLRWGKTASKKRENSEARMGCFHVYVLHRNANPSTALVAFGEERGEVFAFFVKEPTEQKAERFLMKLMARFPHLRLIIAPGGPTFGEPPVPGHPLEDAQRDKYTDHRFVIACQTWRVARGHTDPFRPGPPNRLYSLR